MKRLNLFTISTLLILLNISISSAQENVDDMKFNGGAGYFAARISNYNFNNLNKTLRDNNLKEFDNLSVSFGGGGYGVIHKLVIGGEGFSSTSDNKSDSNYKSNMKLSHGMFKLGYVIYNNKSLFMYPSIGIGSIKQKINIIENKQKTFLEQLNDPKRGVELQNEQLLIDLSINGNVYLSKSSFLSLSWQLGYQISSSNANNWTDQTGTVSNAPEQNYSAPYAQIGLIFGGFNR